MQYNIKDCMKDFMISDYVNIFGSCTNAFTIGLLRQCEPTCHPRLSKMRCLQNSDVENHFIRYNTIIIIIFIIIPWHVSCVFLSSLCD